MAIAGLELLHIAHPDNLVGLNHNLSQPRYPVHQITSNTTARHQRLDEIYMFVCNFLQVFNRPLES